MMRVGAISLSGRRQQRLLSIFTTNRFFNRAVRQLSFASAVSLSSRSSGLGGTVTLP